MTELWEHSAVELGSLLRAGDASAVEVLDAFAARIERVNPRVGAICTLDLERARGTARALDEGRDAARPLHGLPIAIKDLELTAGIRTTFGSPIYRNHVPRSDALFVERLKDAGAILIGKTNTPELGAGSQTFNSIFGRTRNPYDTTKTCGGSSGGAAVAVATGMLPFADGSDLGGSVRNPPAFCNVVGLRPSPGRVPRWPELDLWSSMNVLGPIAKSAEDAALLLSVIAGPDPRAPSSIDQPGSLFRAPLERGFKGVRCAFSRDLGSFPVEPQVAAVVESAARRIEDLGVTVVEAHPDFAGAADTFQTLRAHGFAMAHAEELEAHRESMKDTVVWNIEKGLALTAADIGAAQIRRGELYQRVRSFMEDYEFLLLPTTQVAPFDVEQEWVREIDGVTMNSYIDWMQSCFLISLCAHPAMSVPAGFTADGLPVGLQIVGRHQHELSVLQLGHALEKILDAGRRRPEL